MKGSLFCLLIFSLVVPCQARPQMLVVIADHLTVADVTRPDLPNLARMRAEGQTALMSPGLAQGQDPVATVYATLGAGDSVGVGDFSQGRLAATLAAAHKRTALVGNADGDDTGLYRPASLILPSTGNNDGTMADPAACGGRRLNPSLMWLLTQVSLRDCDLVVVHDGDFARIERENQGGYLRPQAYQSHEHQARQTLDRYLGRCLEADTGANGGSRFGLMLVVPVPPLRPDGRWDSLTPLVLYGCDQLLLAAKDSDKHSVVQSDTTQTWGLVAARDIAPSILAALHVPIPLQMTGAQIEGSEQIPPGDILPRLDHMDRQTRLNQQAQNPFFWSLGFLGAATLFVTMGLYLSGRMALSPGWRRASRYGLRLLSAWPSALLFAPLAHPATLESYLAWIGVLTAAAALLPSPGAIFGLTALALVGDGLTGTVLVSQSALSVYFLSGIRFYGIGNEYMGVLLGGALLLAASLRMGKRPVLLWFSLVTFVLSFPEFGAKAGGAVTAAATFTAAWRILAGRPVKGRHLIGSLAGGFALVFLWALLGHWLPLRHTHIDTAVNALDHGRLGYIAGVALRKVGLAARVLLHPGTLLGLLSLGLVGLGTRLFLRGQVRVYLARHPRFAAVWYAGLWGCLVAVLFNDSGVVAAILLATCLILALLHGLYEDLCVLQPSTSATFGSGSPSVMC